MMSGYRNKTFCQGIIGSLCLLLSFGSGTVVHANLKENDEAVVGVPPPPSPSITWDDEQFEPDVPGWEKRIFSEPLSQYNFSTSKFRSKNRPGISLKSPGKLPGIEFGVEMHSLEALQTVVPPERLPKALNFQQHQPLLLSPSNISPDYNGGFLRFTW